VGRKRPNEWGFCDMVGNVGEWCLDAAAPYDPKSMVDRAVTKRSALKCVRGGTYRASLEGGTLGCDCRGWAESTVRRPWFGVRIALRPRVGLIGR
jgi:formylglycine-generating enzyme required for sulfatase activity